jgi:hypothetical protein
MQITAEWIHINDKLPPMGLTVIVANATCEKPWSSIRNLGSCDDDIDPSGLKWYHTSDFFEPIPFKSVTHWMEIPAPPTVG